MLSKLPFTLLVSLALTLVGCTESPQNDQPFVAQVGDKLITVDDFRFNFEFGLPHLRKGNDPRGSYLDYMIGEELLAMAGYSMGLDKSDRVVKLEEDLVEELLVEELFRQEVHDKITISTEDIERAIRQSKVKWKFRYWAESNLEHASNVSLAMQEAGYAEVVDAILGGNPETGIKPADLETGYLSAMDVTPELLEAIRDLPVGDISAPIAINGVYFIFQIVDIRREPLIVDEFQYSAERYRQILFHRKIREEAKQFVSKFMTPKNLVTKGVPFRLLADALIEWASLPENSGNNFLKALHSATDQGTAMFDLQQNLDQPLVTFAGGHWTIRDFLKRYDVRSTNIDIKDRQAYLARLSEEIALEVRNYFFATEALERKLDTSANVQRELGSWRDKWTYEEARDYYTRDLQVTTVQARDFFASNKHRYIIRKDVVPAFEDYAAQAKRDAYILEAQELLARAIDSLKVVYPVIINHAILDTINVTQSRKSRWLSVQVFKQSSKRMAQPIVDPAWGF